MHSSDFESQCFFKSYGEHRSLHSFPTRRSSDLSLEFVFQKTSKIDRRRHRHARDKRAKQGMNTDRLGDQSASENECEQDRKSTRLNSSHGYISYAVFCLKKKKKYRKTTGLSSFH